jgi:putative two-component system response regulator
VGRICAVGDVFDALISVRPYKHAWPIDEALAELERQAGVLLDPTSCPRSCACATTFRG